jgi:hypothetical protein
VKDNLPLGLVGKQSVVLGVELTRRCANVELKHPPPSVRFGERDVYALFSNVLVEHGAVEANGRYLFKSAIPYIESIRLSPARTMTFRHSYLRLMAISRAQGI